MRLFPKKAASKYHGDVRRPPGPDFGPGLVDFGLKIDKVLDNYWHTFDPNSASVFAGMKPGEAIISSNHSPGSPLGYGDLREAI